jgi:putative phosphoribosyl transferase
MVHMAWEQPYFKNREEAAELLAEKLSEYRGQNPLVLAIPRGAVPMGRILAKELDGQLDVILVRKVGAPDNPEFALGAVGESGELYIAPYASSLHYSDELIEREAKRQVQILKERRRLYTPYRPAAEAQGRTVILVDDGIATGSTAMAAIRELHRQAPRRIIVATAVIPPDVAEKLSPEVHEVVALAVTSQFGAIGEFFEDFRQVSDEEVVRILKETSIHPESKKSTK